MLDVRAGSRLAELKRWASEAPAHVIAQAVLELEQAVAEAAAERDAAAGRSDTPEPCSIHHEAPFDFGQCATHDETFPLGSSCRFDGRDSVSDVLQEEIDRQRGRAVSAEIELAQLHEEHRLCSRQQVAPRPRHDDWSPR